MRAFGRFTLWLFAILGGLTAAVVLAIVTFTLSVRDDAPSLPDSAVLFLDLTRAPAARAGGDPIFSADPAPTLADMLAAIEAAKTDPDIKGLSAEIGGAGLGVAVAQELSTAIRGFRDSGKPATAFAADLGGLGDQMPDVSVATAFRQLWLQPSGGVGFSGIALQSPFFADALESLEIEPQVGQRQEYKGGIDALVRRDFSPPVRRSLQRVVDGWVGQLSDEVALNRGLERGRVRNLVDQGPFLAPEALEAGLVDFIGYVDQADAELALDIGGPFNRVSVGQYLAVAKADEVPAKTVALIYGVGPIEAGQTDDNPFLGSDSFGPYSVAQALSDAREDDDIAAVIFRVDSPGGAYGPSDMVRREVKRLRDAGKPVVVTMGDYAASGGYFVSLDADRIVASPGTLTGSIGVYSGKLATRAFWDELGVRWSSISAGDNAGMWSFIDRFDPDEQARFDAILDSIYDDFTGHVGRARNLDATQLNNAARGRVWLGSDALEVGLVDALGGFPVALDQARDLLDLPDDAPLDLRLLPEPKSPWEQMVEWIDGGGSFDGLVMGLGNRMVDQQVERVSGDMQSLRALIAGPMAMPPVRIAQ
jgi:protease-4